MNEEQNKITLPFLYDYVFPNLILPNGLNPEMGIINYINTQYSNKFRSETFLEINSESQESAFSLIFNHHLGVMPSSLRMNGSYLRQPCFGEIVNIEEDSVYFGKRKFQKYIYPMKITLHFSRFTGFDRIGHKQNGEFFWKHISEEVLQDIRGRRAVVFLDWANENFIDKREFIDLHLSLKRSGIPKEQIVLSINSFNAQEVYESWFAPEERMLEVRNLPFLLTNISWYFSHYERSKVLDLEWLSTKNRIREHYFLFPNRRGRPHRIALLFKLASNGLLEKGDWSLLDNTQMDHGFYEACKVFEIDREKARQTLQNKIPHNLKDENGKTFESDSGWSLNTTSQPFLKSYFYIASETYMLGEYKSLTEKVFKPLVNYMPFIFLSFPGALEELKKLGFKTFHPYIDESYDQETDYIKRMNMIFNEIQKLTSLSKEELHNWYWSMEDILKHNRAHLFTIYKNESISKSFVKYLESKIK